MYLRFRVEGLRVYGMSVCMYVCTKAPSGHTRCSCKVEGCATCQDDLPSTEERTTGVPYPVVLQLYNPEPETVPTLDSEPDDSTPGNALNRYETAQKTLIDHIYKHVKPTII